MTAPTPGMAFGRAMFALGTFFVGTLLWLLVVGVVVAGAMLVNMAGSGIDLDALADPEQVNSLMGPGLMGLSAIIQSGGLAVIAAGLCALLVIPKHDTAGARIRAGLALNGGPWPYFIAAAVGGLTIGFFPGWIAQWLTELLEWENGGLAVINESLTSGTLAGRAVMVAAIVISAPLFEELIFRGFVYKAIETGVGPAAGKAAGMIGATLVSAGLFAMYHMDPVHVLALLPTALFLTVLRAGSGSIWPPIIGHFVNNSLAAVAVFAATTVEVEDPTQLPLWAALLTQLFAWGVLGAAWGLTRVLTPAPSEQS